MDVDNIKNVAVIGAGIMGHGITLACAHGGFHVTMMARHKETLKHAMDNIELELQTLADTGITSKEKMQFTIANIDTTSDLSNSVKNADFVIEAIPEKIGLKKQIFKKLDALCPKEIVLSSNTSTLRISEIAAATTAPHRLIGVHWMNPPYILPLVEVVRGEKTSDETIKVTKEFLTELGKFPVLCKDTPGFIVNRMQSALLIEAISLAEQGIASFDDIDTVWTKHLGLRYSLTGPSRVLDFFGLDTELYCYSYLYRKLRNPKFKPPNLLRQKVAAGELGLKTGKGFHKYSKEEAALFIKERDRNLIELLRTLKLVS